jgi:AraC-like DNA-binding protein
MAVKGNDCFEALSHFSFAFKKQFGLTPTELTEQRQRLSDNKLCV